jgi:hypothetical protein
MPREARASVRKTQPSGRSAVWLMRSIRWAPPESTAHRLPPVGLGCKAPPSMPHSCLTKNNLGKRFGAAGKEDTSEVYHEGGEISVFALNLFFMQLEHWGNDSRLLLEQRKPNWMRTESYQTLEMDALSPMPLADVIP